jgi:DNA-binding transcriptional ArsR family regulator
VKRKTGQVFSLGANTERMSESKLRARLLTHLFRKGQEGENTNLINLARSSGTSLLAVREALASLERAGLVDARRLRLTMNGLALTAAFSERGEQTRAARKAGRTLPGFGASNPPRARFGAHRAA